MIVIHPRRWPSTLEGRRAVWILVTCDRYGHEQQSIARLALEFADAEGDELSLTTEGLDYDPQARARSRLPLRCSMCRTSAPVALDLSLVNALNKVLVAQDPSKNYLRGGPLAAADDGDVFEIPLKLIADLLGRWPAILGNHHPRKGRTLGKGSDGVSG